MSASLTQPHQAQPGIRFDNVRSWLLVITTVILVGAVYMGQTRQAAITGQRVHDKQDRLERLMQENAQLEADIAALMAPSRIEARAKALGLHLAGPDQIKYVTIKNYPVEPARPVASQPPVVAAEPSIDFFSWWNNLLDRVGLSTPHSAEATSP